MNEDNPQKDYLTLQREYCGIYGLDFEKVEKFNSKLISLTQQGISWATEKATYSYLDDLTENLDYCAGIGRLSNSVEIRQKPTEKSLLDLFLYLLLVEGAFSKTVQIISFLLIENDHDLYDPQERRFLTKYEQIEQLPLFIKLQFLDKHGFELIAQSVDRDLRNRIAHIDIEVNLDGKIINKKSDKTIDDLQLKINHMVGVILAVGAVLNFVFENRKIIYDKEMQRFRTKPHHKKPKQ